MVYKWMKSLDLKFVVPAERSSRWEYEMGFGDSGGLGGGVDVCGNLWRLAEPSIL